MPIVCSATDLDAIRTALASHSRLRPHGVGAASGSRPERHAIATKEKAIRRDDRSFDALLLLEALDDASLSAACGVLNGTVSDLATNALRFDQVFALDQAELVDEGDPSRT